MQLFFTCSSYPICFSSSYATSTCSSYPICPSSSYATLPVLVIIFVLPAVTSLPPSPPHRIGQIFMKDAECAETNEKSLILIFAIFYFSSYGDNSSKIDHILSTKMTLTRSEKSDIWFFFRFSTFRIIHVSLTTFEFLFMHVYPHMHAKHWRNYCNICRWR